ncbi:heme ABC exporter ATP-binding protein CcmA [Sphingobium sp. DEHP117]|uniref:heme ABC exporter ATP-binding protein CcmA n=1 Tax=Sphingobium sp. DEHP117 TaxID=2993436 RepID=UPI0027D65376|nr:heme ABC exporter ATP-binding protein CcmA [Sphingobium sp. DEHP117]MDQ4418938.1 heme ABC exporter ATP-binding protein CcmA [Sphingobium sp. DEHP117]
MIVDVSGLACIRGGRNLYSGVSFALAGGESLRVSGPNGVGKSSLLRQICGLLPCRYGSICLDDERGVALADERPALDQERPLRDALMFWARLDGAGPERVDEAIALMALGALAKLPVRMLSTGQRKRAVLARAIASPARLWLLDEPGNGLDDASLDALGQAMDAHVAQGGAIIAASHFALPHRFTHTLDLAEHTR